MNTANARAEPVANPAPNSAETRIDGVVIGLLLGFAADGAPLVAYPGNPAATAVPARSTSHPTPADLGREVALLFEQGDLTRPVLIGVLQRPRPSAPAPDPGVTPGAAAPLALELDGKRLVLRAERELVLECGQARITLTRAGKVLISGAYVSIRSSGLQRIAGAAIEIN